jgi:hypothetical protein
MLPPADSPTVPTAAQSESDGHETPLNTLEPDGTVSLVHVVSSVEVTIAPPSDP